MSIQVENKLKNNNVNDEDILNQRVHFLPFKIEEDGAADVERYFEPYVRERDQQDGCHELVASFRGRPLDGARVPLPIDYTARVITETQRPLKEDAERKLQVIGGFAEMIQWNWDRRVSAEDPLSRALHWPHLAEAIHGD